MKRDADQVISGFANPDGTGSGNWAEETVVGRITKSGAWDRRYSTQRCSVCGAPRHPRIHQIVPRQTNQDSVSLKEFGFAVLVISLTVIAAYLWTAILAAL